MCKSHISALTKIHVTRPSIFGPQPQVLCDIVHNSLRYRKMAHSVEEVAGFALDELFGTSRYWPLRLPIFHKFVLKFNEKPNLNAPALEQLEEKIKEMIDADTHRLL